MKIFKGEEQVEFNAGEDNCLDRFIIELEDGEDEVKMDKPIQDRFLKWFVAHMD